MSNKNPSINEITKNNEDNENKDTTKLKIETNKIKTNISINTNDKTDIAKEKEQPDIKNSQIKKGFFGLSRVKTLRQTLMNSSYEFLNNLGDIKLALIHRNANTPLKKVGEFREDPAFCKCCELPCEEEGVWEKYKYSDSIDEFVQNGQAIPLYFSFYIYSIFILILSFLSISLPSLLISYFRSDELNDICNKIYEFKKIEECKIYLDHADNIEDENKSNFNFILDFSGLNIKNYRIIHKILTDNSDDNLDDIFVNYSLINFVGICTILIIYFGYLILNYNKDFIPDVDILSPKNYSIMITGMDGFFPFLRTNTNFLSIIKKVEKEGTNEVKQESDRESIDEKSVTSVKKFENLFQEKISELFLNDKKKYDIKKVNVCFKINKYIELREKLDKCDEIISLLSHSPYQRKKNLDRVRSERLYYYSPFGDFNIHLCERTRKLSDIKNEQKELQKQIDELLEEAKEINMEKFAGAVIVTFNTIKEKEEFLSHKPKTLFLQLLKMIGKLRYFFCFCCINKIDNSNFVMKYMKINIEEAPNPEDIIFENLEFTQQSKAYRVVGINMISLLLIAIGFGIILGFQQIQIYVNKKDYNKIIYYILSLCITIASSLINIIFEELLDMLTKIEKQSSITDYYLSYSVKLTIFSFLIKGIIPLVVDIILDTSNYEMLITNMFTMFLVNSVITPLIWTLNITPVYWIKKLKICLIEKDSTKYLNLNQKKLNELYEKSDMKIPEKYSYIAKTLLMTFLYISIFPFGVLISLGGFILCYFLEKYNFINNYKRPEILNNTLFFFYLEYFIVIIFFIGVGDYIFLSDVFSSRTWSLVNIIFLGVLIVIPYNYLLKCDFIGFKDININKITYEDAYFEFLVNYEKVNPMVRDEGKKNYIEKLYEKKLIDEKLRDKLLKDFSNINLMNIYYQHRNNRNKLKLEKSIAVLFGGKSLLSKSVLPNQKNLFRLSSLYTSFSPNINPKKKKNLIYQSHNVNGLNSQNKLKNANLLLVNGNEIDNDKEKINSKKKFDLNEVIPIKEENESIKEDEKESTGKKVKFNLGKNEEKKNNNYNNMKRVKLDKNIKEFYTNPLMFKICGSMQVFNYINRDEDEDDNEDLFKDQEEYEEEEVASKNKNQDNDDVVNSKNN